MSANTVLEKIAEVAFGDEVEKVSGLTDQYIPEMAEQFGQQYHGFGDVMTQRLKKLPQTLGSTAIGLSVPASTAALGALAMKLLGKRSFGPDAATIGAAGGALAGIIPGLIAGNYAYKKSGAASAVRSALTKHYNKRQEIIDRYFPNTNPNIALR